MSDLRHNPKCRICRKTNIWIVLHAMGKHYRGLQTHDQLDAKQREAMNMTIHEITAKMLRGEKQTLDVVVCR